MCCCAMIKAFPISCCRAIIRFPQNCASIVGGRSTKGKYFGPFASAGAVNRTLNQLPARVLAAQLHRCGVQQPHAPLFAIPDQAVLGPLRRLYFRRRVWRADAGRRTLLVGQGHAFAKKIWRSKCRPHQRRWSSSAPPHCATVFARLTNVQQQQGIKPPGRARGGRDRAAFG